MSFHFTAATSTATAPAVPTSKLAQVPSLIFERQYLADLQEASSLSALSWNRPAVFGGMRLITLTNAGTQETPKQAVKLGNARQLLIGGGLIEELRNAVRNDPAAIQQQPAPYQGCDHLLLVQQTWDLRIGALYCMLAPFVLAGKLPSSEAVVLLCERYGVPVLAWVADVTGQTFVRGFNLPEHLPQSTNAGGALQ